MTFIRGEAVRRATKPHQVETLKRIALLGGAKEYVAITSRELGRELGTSQQTASERILELVEAGLVHRELAARRQRLRLTPQGLDALRREYAAYRRIFEAGGRLVIRGAVAGGLGEGAFYMKQKGYRDQFRRLLGFEPYEGTLNVRVDAADRASLELLREEEGLPIGGFTEGGRTFGAAKCFRASVRGVECAAVLPLRTHHADILELIAKHHVRTKLGLADGDVIDVEIRL